MTTATATPITPNRTPNKSGFELFAKVNIANLYIFLCFF